MAIEKKGMMFVLSSPSGAGKTTLTKKLAANNNNLSISISHTTRKPRPNEVNGKDYFFVSNSKFEKLIVEKKFFEHANIFENNYGTLKQPVEDLIK
jgi:guanylate kinase